MRKSVTYDKARAFAVRIVRMYQWLCNEKKEFVISKQCLRSGTSIGANLSEGLNGQSRADFVAKMHIALKEACETKYWLEILSETKYLEPKVYESLNEDCVELIKLLTSSIKSTKANQ